MTTLQDILHPIMLRLSVDSIPVKKSHVQSAPRRPAWYKAGLGDINNYTYTLHEKLIELETPSELYCQDPHCQLGEHQQARDSYLLDILIAMIESSHEAIPMGGGKRKRWDPDKNCEIETALPGWRKEIEPLR